jgi:hypothetical protein
VAIPKLNSTDNIPLDDKQIHERWVYPAANFYWLIAEYDPKSRIAFGYACLNDKQNAEWGCTDMAEVESIGGYKDELYVPKQAKEAIEEVLKEVRE